MTTKATAVSIQSDNSKTSAVTGEAQHQYQIVLIDGVTAITATEDFTPLEIGRHGTVFLELSCPAAPDGTNPTLDVTIETSNDGTTWRTLGTFAQLTTGAAAVVRKSFPGADWYIRANCTIGGTSSPSYTPLLVGQCY